MITSPVSTSMAAMDDGAKADITNVCKEWEDVKAVRQHVIKHKVLFKGANGPTESPSVNMKTAILNKAVLLPLAGRLADDHGRCRMITIPDVQREILGKLFKVI